MSENTNVRPDENGIYGATPKIMDSIAEQVLTKMVMEAMNRTVRELASETVSGATKIIGGVEKFPGIMSRDDLVDILERLLPGKFPNSEKETLSFAAPDGKFPPLSPPNKKDENGKILRNEEGLAIKDYSYRPVGDIIKQGYSAACRYITMYANPESKYHVQCQIDPEKHKAVLESMVKGDIGAISNRFFSPSAEHVSRIINKIGVGPTDKLLNVRNEGDKPAEGSLIHDSWTPQARELFKLKFIRAYASKCAAPREDCPDGLLFEGRKLVEYLAAMGFDPKAPAYLNTQGSVSQEKQIIAIGYAAYKSSFAYFHGDKKEMAPPTEDVKSAMEAVSEKSLQQIEQSILANADASPMLMNQAGVETMLNDLAKEASREMTNEALATATMPEGMEVGKAEKKKPGRPRKA